MQLNLSVRSLLMAGLLVMPGLLPATNLVTNPGFETGDSTGWTTGGIHLVCQTGTSPFGGPCLVNSGQYAYNSDRLLSQTLSTLVGQSYTLSFWFATEVDGNPNAGPGDESNTFSVLFGGATVYGPLTNVHQPAYGQVVISILVATGTSTELQFAMSNGPGGFWLDDISVDATSVPEPGTLGMMALAGAWMGRKLLRRR